MEEKQDSHPPRCRFCGRPLSKEDAEISEDTCFDCALTYLAGGAAHTMAEGIRAKKRAEAAQRVDMSEDPTPDEARMLIDGVLKTHGLDPEQATDEHGWRHLWLGRTPGQVGVVEREQGDYHLVVLAPVVRIPAHGKELWGFYKMLLELNYYATSSARFCLHEDTVFLCLSRPIPGLDEEEVDHALQTVMLVAGDHGELLQAVLSKVLEKFPPVAELPNIKMTPKEAQTIGTILARCEPHGQDIFRYLMEGWERSGYGVTPGTSGIGLTIPVGPKQYNLAAIRPGVGERQQLLILGWEGLRRQKVFPTMVIDRFQSAVGRIADIRVTGSTAYIEVTETFDRERAKALLQTLRTLAKAAQPELAEEDEFKWDPSLPRMDIKVGPNSLTNMRETLQACEPRVQQMYATLIEGWHQAGGTVQCSRVGRIYLKLQTGEHEYGPYGRLSHHFTLAALAAPKGRRGPAIDVSWNMAEGNNPYLSHVPEAVARFQAAVSCLPGFEQATSITRLVIDEAFQPEDAQALLDAMVDLKVAEGAAA